MAIENSVIRADADFVIAKMGAGLDCLENTTLLITGSSGFLCSYFLDTLAAFNRAHPTAPCHVIAVDNLIVGSAERVAHLVNDANFTFLHHDVTRPIADLGPVDWIIHGAGIASPIFYRRHPLETIDVNVGGLREQLELGRRQEIRSMVYMSTSEIYGDPDPAHIPTPETYRGNVSCTGPRACYDESKRLGETLCVTYHQLFSVPIKIIRPFNVYGPGISLDDQRIVPDLLASALARRPIELFSDGRATRSFCYVRDFVMGALWVLTRGSNGEPYNIGNDEEVSINQVAQFVAALVDPPLPIRYAQSADQHYLTDNPQRRCPDLAKIRALAPDWKPEIMVHEGLSRTFHSYGSKSAVSDQ